MVFQQDIPLTWLAALCLNLGGTDQGYNIGVDKIENCQQKIDLKLMKVPICSALSDQEENSYQLRTSEAFWWEPQQCT